MAVHLVGGLRIGPRVHVAPPLRYYRVELIRAVYLLNRWFSFAEALLRVTVNKYI